MNRILVVEDEEHIRNNIKDLLILNHYEVMVAKNAEEGLDITKKILPDLILCDVLMPKLNGYEFLEILKKNPSTINIPFIFLTGKSEWEDQRYGMELGADDYLIKPFDIKDLIKAVKIRLEKKAFIEAEKKRKLEELSNNISFSLPHELQTPLTGIIGGSTLLANLDKPIEIDKLKEINEIILFSAERLQSLIKKFWIYTDLTITLNNPDKVELIRQAEFDCYPIHIIKKVAQEIADKFNRKTDLTMELTDCFINISEDSFDKIVQELIENAFKFSKNSTPIKIYDEIKNSTYHLFIINHGRGMTQEEIDNIGAFMQFNRHKYEQQGAGLGLIIAKKIVELYGGNFNIKSVLEEQTTVEITLSISHQ